MQPATPVHHRRLARLNEFIKRQDRIIYTLLIITAAIGLSWVIWRHQYLIYRDQHQAKPAQAVQKVLPMEKAPR